MGRTIESRLKKLEETAQETISPETRAEVERLLKAYTDKYNSPEERQKREAEYAEVQRIGELRKQASLRGESMEQFPLPFEQKE